MIVVFFSSFSIFAIGNGDPNEDRYTYECEHYYEYVIDITELEEQFYLHFEETTPFEVNLFPKTEIISSSSHLDWFGQLCFVTRTVEIGPIRNENTTIQCALHLNCTIFRSIRVYQVHCQQCAIHLRNRYEESEAHGTLRNMCQIQPHVAMFQVENFMTDIERERVEVIDFSEQFNPLLRIASHVWDDIHISMYDEQLDTTFSITLTRPTAFINFDASRTYPALIVVYRGADGHDVDVSGISREMMANGKIEHFFIITLMYDPIMDESEELFMNFITKKLLPFIGEDLFNIDYSRSQFYWDFMLPELELHLVLDFGI